MRNVGGIAQTEAQKSSDLFMKCRYMDELTGGHGVIFATGTPISNSMVELYTIQRYLQYETLKDMNMLHFDDWASNFGETITAIELSHIVPIDSCMCYVPVGRYPLFSTALMLITPAKVAGVKRIAATSPVIKGTDKVNPTVLVAMDIAGADEITAIGGAQAVAAYAYGTESIKEVNIITGPGNKFVTEAKRQCYGKVGIDFTAGPSEVLVIGDESCNPKVAAADLIAQSEHDILAKGIMISTSEKLLLEVEKEVEEQLKKLSTENIARKSWEDNGTLIYCETLEEAAKISNETAPEHLEIMVKNPDKVERLVKNYGSLFIGQYSAEVFGDYSSGTNHTLPTMGGAKYTGRVWVGTYTKTLTRQRLSKEGFSERSEITKEMARAEGLYSISR